MKTVKTFFIAALMSVAIGGYGQTTSPVVKGAKPRKFVEMEILSRMNFYPLKEGLFEFVGLVSQPDEEPKVVFGVLNVDDNQKMMKELKAIDWMLNKVHIKARLMEEEDVKTLGVKYSEEFMSERKEERYVYSSSWDVVPQGTVYDNPPVSASEFCVIDAITGLITGNIQTRILWEGVTKIELPIYKDGDNTHTFFPGFLFGEDGALTKDIIKKEEDEAVLYIAVPLSNAVVKSFLAKGKDEAGKTIHPQADMEELQRKGGHRIIMWRRGPGETLKKVLLGADSTVVRVNQAPTPAVDNKPPKQVENQQPPAQQDTVPTPANNAPTQEPPANNQPANANDGNNTPSGNGAPADGNKPKSNKPKPR